MKSKYTASAIDGEVLAHSDATSFESRTYAKVSRRLIPFLMLCYLG
ncbi:MFS transporter, partial [Paraburkholderia sp. SIMBA_054]